jgi:hypothetical protein
MNLFPPPVIAAAIVAALAMPTLLVLLSWGPRTWRAPGRRYKTSVAIGWLCWGVIALAYPSNASVHPLDWLGGAAVMVAMTLATFNAWTVVAYGVTINMVLALARSEQALDLDAWADHYADGRSIHQICLDRLQHLFMFRLAHLQGEIVRINIKPAGAVMAIVSTAYFLFGLKRPR